MMELAFAEKHLRDVCEHESKAAGKYGTEVASKLRARLADIRAADNFNDVIAGRPRFTEGKISLQLGDGHVLVLISNHIGKNPPADWKSFTRVKIIEIQTAT